MSPTPNRSFALEHSNVIESRNRIMFNFYLGLPRIYTHIDSIIYSVSEEYYQRQPTNGRWLWEQRYNRVRRSKVTKCFLSADNI